MLFLLNIVWALGYAWLVHLNWYRYNPSRRADDYYLLRGAVRLNNLFHLRSTVSPFVDPFPNPGSQIGVELVVAISVLGVAILLLLAFRLINRTSTYRVLLNPVAGFTALLAMPVCYFGEFLLTGKATWHDPLVLPFAMEILCICVLYYIHRKRPFSLLTIGVLFLLYCIPLALVMWPDFGIVIYRMIVFRILIFTFPLSAIIWFLYEREQRTPGQTSVPKAHTPKWTILASVISLAFLLVIWLPSRSHPLSQTQDLNSLRIEMARGSCYGPCPVYAIVLHGNGLVEYNGKQFVRVKGAQTTTISKDQLMQVLNELDRVQFFALEDRAFLSCFDVPSIKISIFIDGKAKSVFAQGCMFHSNGPQDQFYQAAKKIDSIVNTDQWIKCKSYWECR